MKKWIHTIETNDISLEPINCMSNVRGRYVTVENIPFSFYYSVKNSSHGPRVKVTLNSDNMRPNRMSSLKLCDDWALDVNENDKRISGNDLKQMKEFFRKYLIMFLLVWEDLVSEPALGDYLEGRISLAEFIQMADFYNDKLNNIQNVKELEEFCRTNNIVNFYGN